MIYLIGSMRNHRIPEVANTLRAAGHEVFDEWYSPGHKADDYWQRYEQSRGHNYKEALAGWHAKNVFNFDHTHLQRADIAVLLMPAGKSAHLELGWMLGQGKPGYILFDTEPERFDVMHLFATDVFFSIDELLEVL